MNQILHELVEKAIETGITDPLLDWLEEHEHPKAKQARDWIALVKDEFDPTSGRYIKREKSYADHIAHCPTCMGELRNLVKHDW